MTVFGIIGFSVCQTVECNGNHCLLKFRVVDFNSFYETPQEKSATSHFLISWRFRLITKQHRLTWNSRPFLPLSVFLVFLSPHKSLHYNTRSQITHFWSLSLSFQCWKWHDLACLVSDNGASSLFWGKISIGGFIASAISNLDTINTQYACSLFVDSCWALISFLC